MRRILQAWEKTRKAAACRWLFDGAQAEPHAAGTAIDAQNAGANVLAFDHDAARVHERRIGQFADMDEAFEPVFDAGKRAKLDDVGDGGRDNLTGGITFLAGLPRIGAEALDAEGNPASVAVDFEDIRLDFLPTLQDSAGMRDAPPAQFADVDQPFEAAKIKERAEVGQVGDGATDGGTGGDRDEDLRAA